MSRAARLRRCVAVLCLVGMLTGCTNEPPRPLERDAAGATARPGKPAPDARSGGGPGEATRARPRDRLSDALPPDAAFPAGSTVTRSTTLPPRPELAEARSRPADCAAKNAATQYGEGDGEVAVAKATLPGERTAVVAIVRPELDTVRTYRDFLSSCREFTLTADGETLRARNTELDVHELDVAEAIGFTQRTSSAGQVLDSAGVAVNINGATLHVVVADRRGEPGSARLALELGAAAVDRARQMLTGTG